MAERHWIIAYHKQTDICRFMPWAEEWLTFKYDGLEDLQPDWQQLGSYESREDAYMGFFALGGVQP